MIQSKNQKKRDLKRYIILPIIIGSNYVQEPISRARGLPSYQIFFCRQGQGELVIKERKMTVHQGQAMVLFPNEPHNYRGISDEWRLDLLAIDGKSCKDILGGFGIHESGVFDVDPAWNYEAFRDYVGLIATNNDAGQLSKYTYGFVVDFLEMLTQNRSYGVAVENELIQEVIEYLSENYNKEIELDTIAQNVGLSKEYLCTVFKRELGVSIMTFLTNLRIGYARRFLVEYPDKTVAEISAMCGYQSTSYFGKVFRENVGASPDKYRKS